MFDFHHVDPSTKKFTLTGKNLTRRWTEKNTNMIHPSVLLKADLENISVTIDHHHSEGVTYVAQKQLSDGKEYWLGDKVRNLHDVTEQLQFLETAILAFGRNEKVIGDPESANSKKQ
jgi:hypothetical protein